LEAQRLLPLLQSLRGRADPPRGAVSLQVRFPIPASYRICGTGAWWTSGSPPLPQEQPLPAPQTRGGSLGFAHLYRLQDQHGRVPTRWPPPRASPNHWRPQAFGMRLVVFGAAGEGLEAWRWQLRACW